MVYLQLPIGNLKNIYKIMSSYIFGSIINFIMNCIKILIKWVLLKKKITTVYLVHIKKKSLWEIVDKPSRRK